MCNRWKGYERILKLGIKVHMQCSKCMFICALCALFKRKQDLFFPFCLPVISDLPPRQNWLFFFLSILWISFKCSWEGERNCWKKERKMVYQNAVVPKKMVVCGAMQPVASFYWFIFIHCCILWLYLETSPDWVFFFFNHFWHQKGLKGCFSSSSASLCISACIQYIQAVIPYLALFFFLCIAYLL